MAQTAYILMRANKRGISFEAFDSHVGSHPEEPTQHANGILDSR